MREDALGKILQFARQRYGYILVILPIVIYWVYWTLNPSYWSAADPAAWYFLDSLSIFAGNSYVYVDHPGTPVQLTGSFLLALTYPFFSSHEAFINFYISKPEAFFLQAHLFLLVIYIFSVVFFYDTAISMLKDDGVLGAAALTVLYFVLHPYSFSSLTFWSHNSFNFPFGTLWPLWLYRELRGPQEIGWRKLVLMGFTAGAIAMTQIYFISWLISGALALFVFVFLSNKSFKKAIASSSYMLTGGVLGIIAMFVPVYKEVPRFIDWLSRITLHQGLYGMGERGIYSFAMFSYGIAVWWATIRITMLVLLLVLVLLVVIIYFVRKLSLRLSPDNVAMLIGLFIQTGLVLLVMGKAVDKVRYSLSLATVLPVFLLFELKILALVPQKKLNLRSALYIGILCGVMLTMVQELGLQKHRAFVEKDASIAFSQAVKSLAKRKNAANQDIVVIYAYAVPLRCAGLLQASTWIGSFREEIAVLCPNQYAIYDTEIELNTKQRLTELEDIDWDLVVWPGNGSDLPERLHAMGAENIPKSWHVRRSKWFFIHSNDNAGKKTE